MKKIEEGVLNRYYYRVESEDSWELLEEKLACKQEILQSINHIDKLREGQCLVVLRQSCIHIVKPMETFQTIAKLYGVSEEQIREKNELEQVYIGQPLII